MVLTFKTTRYYTKYGKKLYMLSAWYDGVPIGTGGNHKTLASVRHKKAELKKKFER